MASTNEAPIVHGQISCAALQVLDVDLTSALAAKQDTVPGTAPSNWSTLATGTELSTGLASKQDTVPGTPPSNWSDLATDTELSTGLASKQDTVAGTAPSNWSTLATGTALTSGLASKQDTVPGTAPSNWSTLATSTDLASKQDTVPGTAPSNWSTLATDTELSTGLASKQDTVPGTAPSNWSDLATDTELSTGLAAKQDLIAGTPPSDWSELGGSGSGGSGGTSDPNDFYTSINTSVNLGANTGWSGQQIRSVAIGGQAGVVDQDTNAVAIGYNAAHNNQSSKAIAIGSYAGSQNQGYNCVAIGPSAGQNNQPNYSIVISAAQGACNPQWENTCHITPVRNTTGPTTTNTPMYYDAGASEVYHTPNGNGLFSSVNTGSDARMKSRTQTIQNASSALMQLHPCTYEKHVNFRVEAEVEDSDLTGVEHITEAGLIAQEVEQIAEFEWTVQNVETVTKTYHEEPELNEDGSPIDNSTSTTVEYKAINYTNFISYLIKGFQEQQEEINTLKAVVAELQSN